MKHLVFLLGMLWCFTAFSDHQTGDEPDIISRPAINSLDDYNHDQFSGEQVLEGHGSWVDIGGTRYWSPYVHRTDWSPYQDGYWSWDTQQGWTWVSYESWGWYAYHYGRWYHHSVYGWVWSEDPERRYAPHRVTFFYGDDYIGWYPYDSSYSAGYRHGYQDGFDDGYWYGHATNPYAGYHRWTPGFTVVSSTHFFSVNIFGVRITDFSLTHSYWNRSYSSSYYGLYVGASNHHHSYLWVSNRCGAVPHVNLQQRYYLGGVVVRSPQHIYAVPPQYRRPVYVPPTRPFVPRFPRPVAPHPHRPIVPPPVRPIGPVPSRPPVRPVAPVPPTYQPRPLPPRHHVPGSPHHRPVVPQRPRR